MTSNTQKSSVDDIVSISVGDFIIFNDSRTYTVDNSGAINLSFDNQILITGEAYQPIQFISNYGSPPTGIISGQTYWIIPSTLTKTSFKIAESIEDAISSKAVNVLNDQSGQQYCTPYANVTISSNSIYSPIGCNVLALNLTEGDWEIWGNVVWCNMLAGSSTVGYLSAGFSTKSSTLVPYWSSNYPLISVNSSLFNGTGWTTQHISPIHLQFTETSLVYMVAQIGGGTGYIGACGYMAAKRLKE